MKACLNMVGGLAVISDVPKTMVYRISRYVNSLRPVIPEATLEKPPSAELRPDQKDSDTLPPYDVLDAILEDYVEELHSAEQIAKERGFELGLIRRVLRMVPGGDDVDAEIKKLLRELRRDAETCGRIFAVCDDEVDRVIFNQRRQLFLDDGSARPPKDVADEEYSQ